MRNFNNVFSKIGKVLDYLVTVTITSKHKIGTGKVIIVYAILCPYSPTVHSILVYPVDDRARATTSQWYCTVL